MAGKAASGDIKAGDLLAALRDLIILALLMVAAAFGGYYYGLHERVAPVVAVAPGTPGALPATAVVPTKEIQNPLNKQPATGTTTIVSPTTTPTTNTSATTSATSPAKGKMKYWLVSSGEEYVGYQVIASINDQPVDNFFGPDKMLEVTRYIKHGDNTITFESKAMGDKFNKHKGDASAQLKVQLVSAPHFKETFSPSDVLASVVVSATGTEDDTETKHFADNH